MAWDDYLDQCDTCSLFNGFDGSDEEAKIVYEHIECESKKDCLARYKDEEKNDE